jgi:GNAT superfamily N-acetyltransferase
MDWYVEPVPYDHADAERLRLAQRQELDERYGSGDHEPGTPPSAGDVPIFLVARDTNGVALACGGLRPLPDSVLGPGAVEVKRMYVAPEARGSGIATAVLRALEAQARRLGSTRLVLETGTMQPDAIRFYEREGYEPIPLFGAYADSPWSVCYARAV